MKKLLFPLVLIWKDAKTPLEYFVALWVTGLLLLFIVGWTGLVIKLINDPSAASNATFGIFDTLG